MEVIILKSKRIPAAQLIRHIIQLAAIILFPGLFVTVLSSLRDIVTALIVGGFSFAAFSSQLITVLVVFLSRLSAVRRHCPVTIFLIAGIFPLVPGAGIYWTAYYVVTDQLAKASDRGFQTLKIAVAIVLGILFVFEFPQKWFRWAERGTAAAN